MTEAAATEPVSDVETGATAPVAGASETHSTGAPRPDRTRVLDIVGLVARLVLGGLMIWAALAKLADLDAAVRAVGAYQLPFSYQVESIIGIGLPVVELVAGVLLVLGLFTRTAALVVGLLLVVFMIGIAQAWARGLSIDCGCFGGGGAVDESETLYAEELLRDLGMLALAAYLVWRPRTLASLNRLLRWE